MSVKSTCSIALSLIAALLLSGCASADPFSIEGDVVTVQTERYRMTFEAGAMTLLENKLTGETYTSPSKDVLDRLKHLQQGLATTAGLDEKTRMAELVDMHKWLGTFKLDTVWRTCHHPSKRSIVSLKKLDGGKAVARWTGLVDSDGTFHGDESFELEMQVLGGSGDLQILARGASPRPGVFGSGFAMMNLRRDLKFIMPVTQGFWFVPKEIGPRGQSSHWPTPWEASIVIAESGRGSVGFWMADKLMRDRYLHFRNTEETFDLVFESVNQAPFADDRTAESRPIRINVYKGNWTNPAGAFRDWWAKAFDVKPLAEKKPDWVDRTRWVVSYPTLPPQDLAPNTIAFAPQIWKVQPPKELGDQGLFPLDIEKGPELFKIKNLLPRYQEMGGHMMVYLNISHMAKGHPWAGKFWDHRIRRPFDMPKEEQDPKFMARGSFVVNVAYKPWQDLIFWWAEETEKRFGIKGFYMDCARGIPNDAQGLIDGKNGCQGEVELMKRMKRDIPGCFLGCEYLNEVTAQVADNGDIGYDNWFGGEGEGFMRGRQWREAHVHPIIGYLFSPYVHVWFFKPNPVFDEVMGRISTAAYKPLPEGSLTDYCETMDFNTFRALYWAEHMPTPYFPDPYEKNVRAYYRDKAGNTLKAIAETPREGRMVRYAARQTEAVAPELVYWRIQDRTEAALAPDKGIEGWCAYRGDTAIGLNPDKPYLYIGKPRIERWQVADMPRGCVIYKLRVFDDMLVMELDLKKGMRAVLNGRVEVLCKDKIVAAIGPDGPVKLTEAGKDEAGRFRYQMHVHNCGAITLSTAKPKPVVLDKDGSFNVATLGYEHYAMTTGSGIRQAIPKDRYRTPSERTKSVPLWPAWGGNASVDYLVALPKVPAGKKLVMSFKEQLLHWKNNHCLLSVKVGGHPVHQVKRQGGTPEMTHEVDLSRYAGQTVLVTVSLENAYLFSPLNLNDFTIGLR